VRPAVLADFGPADAGPIDQPPPLENAINALVAVASDRLEPASVFAGSWERALMRSVEVII
jgi:hypothetical protein